MFQFSRPLPNINRPVATPLALSTRLTPDHFASLPSRLLAADRISLFEANETRMPRLRNFDTEPRSPYCYEVALDTRLESVANAHTAADLHVHPVS
jgi:hypothetical protein